MNEGGKLTGEQAQEIGKDFLLERYRRGKITFSGAEYTTEKEVPSYRVEGVIKVRPGTVVSQYLWPEDVYSFKIWVSARGGRILTWEMH